MCVRSRSCNIFRSVPAGAEEAALVKGAQNGPLPNTALQNSRAYLDRQPAPKLFPVAPLPALHGYSLHGRCCRFPTVLAPDFTRSTTAVSRWACSTEAAVLSRPWRGGRETGEGEGQDTMTCTDCCWHSKLQLRQAPHTARQGGPFPRGG